MSRVVRYQSSFAVGEIDPLLRGRIDIQQYYAGVSQAKNVIFEPQGGFSRRPGMKFINDVTSSNASNGSVLIPFEFSTEDTFMVHAIAFNTTSTIRFQFYKNQQLVTNLNSTTNDYVDVNVGILAGVSNFDIRKCNWAQSADTLILVHPNFNPIQIKRGANNQTWTATFISLTPPLHQFLQTTAVGTVGITPSGTDDTVTITAASAIFNTTDVGQYIETNDGFGRARIIKYTSATEVDALAEVPFFDTTQIAASDWFFDRGYEDAWSNTRGWPGTVTFHEGRLWFGGSYALPSTLFGSKVAQYFNFSQAEGLDDDAIKATLTTDNLNNITGMRSGRDLQIFTTGGEWFLPQSDLDPITPLNIVLKTATKRGSKEGIRPQAAETGTLFIQRQGKTLREMLFSDVELSYVSNNISLLSSHMLVDPVRMALRPATDTTEGDLLLIVNGTNDSGYRAASTGFTGGIAAFMLNKQQNVVAPSFLSTDGVIEDVAVDLDTIYLTVKRTIGGVDKYYVEVFDDDFTTDSAVQTLSGFSGTTYGGHDHLDGKSVAVIRDDIVDPNVTVASGNITTLLQPTSYVEAGLDYDVVVETMPIELQSPTGNVQSIRKRVVEVSPILYRSQNIAINDIDINLQTLPLSPSGGVANYTGVKKVQGFLGYSREAKIKLSMTKPLFLTVLALDYSVSVGA